MEQAAAGDAQQTIRWQVLTTCLFVKRSWLPRCPWRAICAGGRVVGVLDIADALLRRPDANYGTIGDRP